MYQKLALFGYHHRSSLWLTAPPSPVPSTSRDRVPLKTRAGHRLVCRESDWGDMSLRPPNDCLAAGPEDAVPDAGLEAFLRAIGRPAVEVDQDRRLPRRALTARGFAVAAHRPSAPQVPFVFLARDVGAGGSVNSA